MSIYTSIDAANKGAVFDGKRDNDRDGNVNHCRVLLVFNQAHIVRVLKAQLEQIDCTVLTAHSAEKALEMIHQYSFDAVLIDTELSGMGAEQLCMNINRQMQITQPQLFLTGVNAISIAAQPTDWPTNALGLAWPISVSKWLEAFTFNEKLNVSAISYSKVRDKR